MSLPSFPCNLPSDPCWGAQVLSYLCVFWVVLDFVPSLKNLGKIQVMGEGIRS